MYTLDTNAIIYYIKNDNSAVSVLKPILGQELSIYVSTITEIELFSFSNLTESEAQIIESILSTIAIVNIDSSIARTASSLRRLYGLKLADSVIAATALFTNSVLLTRNIRDFKKVPKLTLLKI